MPDKQSDLSIVIEAVNNASGKIKEVEKDIKNTDVLMSKNFDTYKLQGDKLKHFQESEKKYWQEYNQSLIDLNTEMGRFSSSSDKASSALGDLSMEAAMGALKMAGLTIAISEVVSLLGEAVRIAGQFESSILGVSATARIFGQDVDRTKSAIVSLTEDGLMNQIQAAEGLQEIMTTGLGLEESIGLMERFKDVAAFGGKNTLDYNNKVQMLFESFKTGYSEQAKSAGLMLTWNEIIEVGARKLGKKVENLTLAEKAMAKYLGIMEVTAGEENQAALLTDTYAGTVSELNNAKTELMNTIGQGLMPVMVEFMKTLTVTIKKLAGLKVVAQAIATVFQNLQFLVKQAGNYISGTVAMIINAWGILVEEASKITIDPRSWLESGKNAIRRYNRDAKVLWNVMKDDAIQIAIDTQSVMEKTWGKGTKDITDGIQKGVLDFLHTVDDATTQAMKKQQEMLEKENEMYQRAVEKRVKVFEESFEDLILSHRDTIKKLTDDLEDENRDYQKKTKDLLYDYNEAMEEIEVRHRDKTESVMEDMEDERKKIEEEIDKITEKYNEERILIEREGEARLNNLKVQLDREVALGVNANQEKIEALEQMIAYEESGLSNALDDKKSKYDEEVSDIEEKLSEKLTKLKEELDEEDILFTEAMDKRELQYERDLIEFKESYEEKRQVIQEELDSELSIREKYAGDFERLADKVAEDDLTRLIRKHNEELSEMERDHIEKLAGIESNSFEQGKSFSENLSDGIEAGYPAVKASIGKIEDDLNSLGKVYEDFETKASWMQGFPSWQPMGFTTGGGGSGGGSGGAWQQGGLAMQPGLVGEAGPEIVLPLSFPKRMAQIMQSLGMSGGKSEVVQNFYVTVQSQQDVDVLMERAGFALKQGGY